MERRYEVRMKALMNECTVSPTLFDGITERLEDFVQPFAEYLSTSQQSEHFKVFVSGLTSNLKRKNTESIAYCFDHERGALQRFIGSVPWDHRPMLMELTRQVAAELGEEDGVIVFDPSAFSKKGNNSVGVQRQWNGRLGKVDNCQVGIYMGYATRIDHTLVDVQLYLPEERAKDKKHRKQCGVPKEVRFATRLELSLKMLKEKGDLLPHAWVAGDDELGRSTQFRRDLRELTETYLLAVPSNTLVRDLEAEPPPYCGRGVRPKAPFVRVDAWRVALSKNAWTQIDVRDGEKGPLIVHAVKARVLAITERTHPESEETLVIFRTTDEEGNTKYDYHLSNADFDTSLEEFARVAKAEHRIEECLQRAKGEAGLADYEVRTWWGWHHHQTLSLLATWFLVQETRRGGKIHSSTHAPAGPLRIGDPAIPGCGALRLRSPGARLPTPFASKRTSPVVSPQETESLATIAC
jgi:SRSO17 transposase